MKVKTRKILAVIILAIMVLVMFPITKALAVTDNKPRFTIVQNIIMKRGENSELDVTVNEKLNFTRFEAELDYGDGIEITEISEGEILPNDAELSVIKENNKITGFAIDSNKVISVDAGDLVKINVKADDNAEPGKYLITWKRTLLLDDKSQNMSISELPGSVIITESGETVDKKEFSIIWTPKMFPGEEQTISVKTDDEMGFSYIQAEFLYDENMSILDVTRGKDLPEDTEVVLLYDDIVRNIIGFSIQSDNVIQIDPNCELVNIQMKIPENATPEKGEFIIAWNHILNGDWKETIADNNVVDIEISPQITSEEPEPEEKNNLIKIFVTIAIILVVVIIMAYIIKKEK